jgi:hypothetical protein
MGNLLSIDHPFCNVFARFLRRKSERLSRLNWWTFFPKKNTQKPRKIIIIIRPSSNPNFNYLYIIISISISSLRFSPCLSVRVQHCLPKLRLPVDGRVRKMEANYDAIFQRDQHKGKSMSRVALIRKRVLIVHLRIGVAQSRRRRRRRPALSHASHLHSPVCLFVCSFVIIIIYYSTVR